MKEGLASKNLLHKARAFVCGGPENLPIVERIITDVYYQMYALAEVEGLISLDPARAYDMANQYINAPLDTGGD